jgi:hypothetical protein
MIGRAVWPITAMLQFEGIVYLAIGNHLQNIYGLERLDGPRCSSRQVISDRAEAW